MDYQSLTRRELQALCKKNKIPANMTNVAMADALKALEIVEGIEDLIKPTESETAQSSLESPDRTAVTSPNAPRTRCRTSTPRKPVKEEPEVLQSLTMTRRATRRTIADAVDEPKNDVPVTPAMPSGRRRASACRKMESQLNECEEGENKKTMNGMGEEKKEVLETPAAAPSFRRRGTASSARRKVTTQLREEHENNDVLKEKSVVERVYSTRRSARLSEKKMRESNLKKKEKLESVALDSFSNDIPENLEAKSNEGSDDLLKISDDTSMSGIDFLAIGDEGPDFQGVVSSEVNDLKPDDDPEVIDESHVLLLSDEQSERSMTKKDNNEGDDDSENISVAVCGKYVESDVDSGENLDKTLEIDSGDDDLENISVAVCGKCVEYSGETLDKTLGIDNEVQDEKGSEYELPFIPENSNEDSEEFNADKDHGSDGLFDVSVDITENDVEFSIFETEYSKANGEEFDGNKAIDLEDLYDVDGKTEVLEHGADEFSTSDNLIEPLKLESGKELYADKEKRSEELAAGVLVSESVCSNVAGHVASQLFKLTQEYVIQDSLCEGLTATEPEVVNLCSSAAEHDEYLVLGDPNLVREEVDVNPGQDQHYISCDTESNAIQHFGFKQSVEENLRDNVLSFSSSAADHDEQLVTGTPNLVGEEADVNQGKDQYHISCDEESNPILHYGLGQSIEENLGDNISNTNAEIDSVSYKLQNLLLATEDEYFSSVYSEDELDLALGRNNKFSEQLDSEKEPKFSGILKSGKCEENADQPVKDSICTSKVATYEVDVSAAKRPVSDGPLFPNAEVKSDIPFSTMGVEPLSNQASSHLTPMQKSSSKTPTTVKRMPILPDDKEIIDHSGRKLELTIDEGKKNKKNTTQNDNVQSLHDTSLRQLRKMVKEVSQIHSINNNVEKNMTKAAKMRPALQTLPENRLGATESERQN